MNSNYDLHGQPSEITLEQLFAVIWRGKWFIMACVIFCSAVAVWYALKLPNVYKAEAVLAPVTEESGLKIPGQLGGLAALAGVNLGSSGSKNTALAIEVLKSRGFLMRFIEKHDLYVPVIAAKGWDRASNTLVIDEELYDSAKATWVRKPKPFQNIKPSALEVHKELRKKFTVNQEKASGMVKISLEHYSAVLATEWLMQIVKDLNDDIRIRNVTEAESSIAFLQQQLKTTDIADVRTMLYSLIEEQTKTLMLANVRDEYVLKVVDPAVVPEEKSGPMRALTVVLAAFLGAILAILIVFLALRRR
ncbi:LPS O-antigen length regulator [Rheinheimera sp. D18]|uniref:Wzz/FepE/Etk N-terminal domain-containing protein n=1 Tax=Rheinheimera sp. D18 TaxID=2545632 RepID=UPI0010522D76|nr:Wzz/FepE/Etk N-terminal domain-containing protein [Rheinheimera sp. D18]QBL09820.1 LPS O-antigen length regulator [Rheinheimera sp. D18]